MTPLTIAIDYGTTRTKVAYYDEVRQEPAIVQLGREVRTIIPSVHYIPKTGERQVGDDALEMLDTDPSGIIIGLKKEIHRSGKVRRPPVEIARITLVADLFSYIRKHCIEEVFHNDITQCVVTVPVAFEEPKRDCIREAARLGGFNEVDLIEEPVSAARAWLRTEGRRISDTVIVCDVGGGTTDFALLRYRGHRFEQVPEVPTAGLNVGGNDVDERIWESVLKDSGEVSKSPPGRFAYLIKLRRIKELFTRDRRDTVPLTLGRTRFDVRRETVEQCAEDYIQRVADEMKRFLERCRAVASLEDTPVLLVGGAARLPGLQQTLQSASGAPVYKWNYSEYATVLGAVDVPLQAAPVQPKDIPPPTPGPDAQEQIRLAELSLRAAETLKAENSDDKQELYRQHLHEALLHAQAACDLASDAADGYFAKAKVLEELEEWAMVVAAAAACLRVAPDHAQARTMRAFACLHSGDYTAAQGDLDIVIAAAPGPHEHFFRAVARWLAKNDAEGAISDLRAAVGLSDQENERAAWNAIAGCLLRSSLDSAQRAMPFFGASLSDLPSLLRLERALEFTRYCDWFGLVESLLRQHTAEGRLVDPIPAIQRELWLAIRAACNECSREAVELFVDLNGAHPVECDEVWQDTPEFARFQAGIWASRGAPDKAIQWLIALWRIDPAFPAQRLLDDPGIKESQDPKLRDFLTPNLPYKENHGAVFNDLTITNKSPFRVTSVTVDVSVTRTDGTQDPPIRKDGGDIPAGTSRNWENVFRDGGWFGANIKEVRVVIKCAEQRLPGYSDFSDEEASPFPEVLSCPSCGRSLRVPRLGKEITVTCPACKGKFDHRSQ